MLDRDLAELYDVETKILKRAVRRNIDRFPNDFMFELHSERIPRPPPVDCGVSERIKKLAEFLTVEGSLQLAAGNLQKIIMARKFNSK